jgi:LysR family transcriptional regulator for metE and metH
MAVVPVKLGSKGIAKQIYLGAREAELHTDYLQAFMRWHEHLVWLCRLPHPRRTTLEKSGSRRLNKR